MEKVINIAVNSDEAVGKLANIGKIAKSLSSVQNLLEITVDYAKAVGSLSIVSEATQEMSGIVAEANAVSMESFSILTEVIGLVSEVFGETSPVVDEFTGLIHANSEAIAQDNEMVGEYSGSIGELAGMVEFTGSVFEATAPQVDMFTESVYAGTTAVAEAIGMMKEYSAVMEENKAMTTALEVARMTMNMADLVTTEGIMGNIEALMEQTNAMMENEAVTNMASTARDMQSMADALSTEKIYGNIEALMEQTNALMENEAMTNMVSMARDIQSVTDALSTEKIWKNIEALIEQTSQLLENHDATNMLSMARNVEAEADDMGTAATLSNIEALIASTRELMTNKAETVGLIREKLELRLAEIANTLATIDGSVATKDRTRGEELLGKISNLNTIAYGVKNTVKFLEYVLSMKLIKARTKEEAQKKKSIVTSKAEAKADSKGALAKLAKLAATPIIGIGLVAAAVAATVAAAVGVSAIINRMATGGVATGTTFAMIGEGKYDEAVIPLGNSPQFNSMKEDIADAVIQGMSSIMGRQAAVAGGPSEIVLNIDGSRLARIMLPNLESEQKRVGYKPILREV